MFSLTDPSSVELVSDIMCLFTAFSASIVPIVVCGSKSDAEDRVIMPHDIEEIVKDNLQYYEIAVK